ncbi:hypothetical protein BCR42DRAFT_398823 [Absidia repens]|uniref:Transmembrane protein n=1 Tax=Absidia repens TaxID=90262 RepID=A0A1X2HR91_9FUNG|nr:hypothetical protein BCR42DRAFT_398823 [Absidia repens]
MGDLLWLLVVVLPFDKSGNDTKFDTEGGGGGTDGKVYVSIGDSSIVGGGYNGFLDRSFNRRFEGSDNWYCSVCQFSIQIEKLQVDHPFVFFIYFVNFVANLHVRVKMPTNRFHSHGPTMTHKIIALTIVVVAVHIIGYSQK